MINTLQNSPEKVPSKWGNKFKKAITLAIALTLSGEPAEAKTYEKQEFPTEMVSNIPWEYAPMTENAEQATVPNYINQAQNWVKKYYPQYEEYFKAIFNRINWLNSNSKYLINSKIFENFDTFSEELTSDKDKITTILLVLEKLSSHTDFKNSIKIWNEDLREWIAKEIIYDIWIQIKKEIKDNENRIRDNENRIRDNENRIRDNENKIRDNENKIRDNENRIRDNENKINKLKEIINIINTSNRNKETTNKIILKIEELFKLFELNEIKNNQWLQKVIKEYISLNKQINRQPNNLWKNFINEYYRINNK